ncbi:hypothetical protein KM043_003193 [Ampulex compressa]|nr:hypothetical protein KM043_003193 [Ampulex compressa]
MGARRSSVQPWPWRLEESAMADLDWLRSRLAADRPRGWGLLLALLAPGATGPARGDDTLEAPSWPPGRSSSQERNPGAPKELASDPFGVRACDLRMRLPIGVHRRGRWRKTD